MQCNKVEVHGTRVCDRRSQRSITAEEPDSINGEGEAELDHGRVNEEAAEGGLHLLQEERVGKPIKHNNWAACNRYLPA